MNMMVAQPHMDIAVSKDEGVNAWKASLKRGTISGVGVSVSGAGAWAQMEGNMNFSTYNLEKSSTYNELKSHYKFSAGTGGFWGWLVGGAHTEKEKSAIHQVFHEVTTQQKTSGTVHINLYVSGIYPDVEVDASAYVLVLQVQDSQGNTYNMMSSTDGPANTGAQDTSGNQLPTNKNTSTITL